MKDAINTMYGVQRYIMVLVCADVYAANRRIFGNLLSRRHIIWRVPASILGRKFQLKKRLSISG